MNEKPIEVFCPICGFNSPFNEIDEELKSLPREEKLQALNQRQKEGEPVFTCSGCDDPEGSAKIIEFR